jgi:GTP-binding protein LepA
MLRLIMPYWDAYFLVKVDILLNATIVDALSLLIHVDNAYHIGKMCEIERIDSRQQFDIPIQAAV